MSGRVTEMEEAAPAECSRRRSDERRPDCESSTAAQRMRVRRCCYPAACVPCICGGGCDPFMTMRLSFLPSNSAYQGYCSGPMSSFPLVMGICTPGCRRRFLMCASPLSVPASPRFVVLPRVRRVGRQVGERARDVVQQALRQIGQDDGRRGVHGGHEDEAVVHAALGDDAVDQLVNVEERVALGHTEDVVLRVVDVAAGLQVVQLLEALVAAVLLQELHVTPGQRHTSGRGGHRVRGAGAVKVDGGAGSEQLLWECAGRGLT